MLTNLKSQECVNRFQRVGILCGNAHSTTALNFLKLVSDFSFERLHYRHPRRSLIMNQHRRIEISVRKHLHDMSEVHSDLVTALNIARDVGGYFDCAAVLK